MTDKVRPWGWISPSLDATTFGMSDDEFRLYEAEMIRQEMLEEEIEDKYHEYYRMTEQRQGGE